MHLAPSGRVKLAPVLTHAAQRCVRHHRFAVMNWEVVGSTGEWAGAIAVVATLFYLARQISQSNRLGEADAEREWFDTWNAVVTNFAEDEKTAELVQKGLSSYHSLKGPQKMVFNARMASVFNQTDLARRLCEKGVFSQDVLDKVLGICAGIITTKGGGEWWQAMGAALSIYEYMETWKKEHADSITPLDHWDAWRWEGDDS